ncbi:MAG: tetratricopeptide repeat protein [Polyangiaceae bacterium]
MKPLPRGLLLGALISLMAPALHAQSPAQPEAAPAASKSVAQLNEEGTAFYQQRDYRRAIERFIQAYAIDPDPNLLFNVARSYERLGEVDAAIEKYEQFLNTPGADASGRSRAQESLRALRESKSAPAPAASHSGEPVPAASSATSAPDASAGPSLLPWVVLGGGVVFTTVGVSLYLLGASDHNEVTDARGYGQADAVVPMTRAEAEDLVSSGDTKKLIGGIGLGLGGALLTTYVILLATGSSSSSEDVAFAVAPTSGGARMSLAGSF